MSLLYEKVVQEDLNLGPAGSVTVTNPGGGSLTGTQISIYSFAVGQTIFTTTWNPASIASAGYETKDISVPGAAVNDFVMVVLDSMLTNSMILTAHVSAADTVTAVLYNPTVGAINVGSGTLGVVVFKSL
jgi:succinyl-CoA synthetase alpha subunit